MKQYRLHAFNLDRLELAADAPVPSPGRGEVLLRVEAMSLNYRDLLVIRGLYNARLKLPATPISDAAGVVAAVGDGVTEWKTGDPVVTHFVADWIDGPMQADYLKKTLGTPGPGMAAELVVVPAQALLRRPAWLSAEQAATLPIAGLTAWSALRSGAGLEPRKTVLTLGTGGVSVFVVQLAKAAGARVIITSSSDEKLERARRLGADVAINYRSAPQWEKAVMEATGGVGADVTVETGGAETVPQSIAATRAGGHVAILGAVTGLDARVNLGSVMMRRITLHGIMVDSRSEFERLLTFMEQQRIEPVIDRTYGFEQLVDALNDMAEGRHFGKLVVRGAS